MADAWSQYCRCPSMRSTTCTLGFLATHSQTACCKSNAAGLPCAHGPACKMPRCVAGQWPVPTRSVDRAPLLLPRAHCVLDEPSAESGAGHLHHHSRPVAWLGNGDLNLPMRLAAATSLWCNAPGGCDLAVCNVRSLRSGCRSLSAELQRCLVRCELLRGSRGLAMSLKRRHGHDSAFALGRPAQPRW